MDIFYHIPILIKYPVHHIWGNTNGYFIMLARTGEKSYILTTDEIKDGNWLYARLQNEEMVTALYKKYGLENAPTPAAYPADVVFYKSVNAVCIARPIPEEMSINDWASLILKHEPLDHFILASIMITLFVNRNKTVLKNQMLVGNNPQQYFSDKVDHLRFCLEQKRRIEDFGV